jgi:hypothetical protein
MTLQDQSVGASVKRVSWRDANPRGLFLRIVHQNRTSPPDEQKELFWREVMESRLNLRSIVEFFCDAQLAQIRVPTKSRTRAPVETHAATAKLRTKLAAHIKQEAEILLLDLIMPNGKPLRLCTGQECTQFGGWYAKLGRRAGKKQIGAVLSEVALREIWKKHA